jgi:very-short-patch-repair endonuclease
VPVLLDDGDAIAPDVAFWQARLVIEVEGDHHRVDRKQWLVDLDRYNRLQRLDVETHRVVVKTADGTRRQLGPIVERIRQRWDQSRQPPPIAPFFHGEPALGNEPWLFREH